MHSSWPGEAPAIHDLPRDRKKTRMPGSKALA